MLNPFSRQKKQEVVRDDTYSSLPPPGEEDPDKLAPAKLIAQRFRIESATARGRFIGEEAEYVTQSENLYHFGRVDGGLEDDRPTINRIGKTLNSFEASACRTSPSMTLKVCSSHDDGYWVMKKPFTFHAPTDPQTGKPQINPLNGMPYQDVALKINDEIPEEIVEQIPSHRRIQINAESVKTWEQITFDIIRDLVDMDLVCQQMVHNKQIVGWQPVLFEYDPVSELPEFQIYPLRQWYLDPMASDVKKMNRLGLDMIVDAESAKRKYPKASKMIDESAGRSLKFAAGQMGYDPLYFREVYATPIVTLAFTWLRNQEVPMTLEEAVEAALVTVEQSNDEAEPSEEAGEAGGEVAQTEGDEPQNGQAGDAGGDDGDGEESNIVDTSRTITHSKKKSDLSKSFYANGKPAAKPHKDHPTKTATIQWIQIDDEVVPGSYIVCPHWDIPVILDKNTEVMYQPFAYPETVSLKSPQYVINSMFTATTNHAEWFTGPTTLVSKSITSRIEGGFVNGFAEPGRCFAFDDGGDENFDINKHYLLIQPPPMPPALPAVLADVQHSYELIADAGVNNGTPPPGVTSGKMVVALQAGSQNTNDLKSMHTERALRRAANLSLYAQIHWMSIAKILEMNKSVPAEIVKTHFLPLRKEMLWDVAVSLPTGAGQVKQQRDQQMFQYFQAQLVDPETAQDALDLPSEEIARNQKESRKELMAEQAEAQAKAAPQGPQQPPGPNISINVGYQYLQPEAQSGVLQLMGLPPLQNPMTIDQQHTQAKIQNEATRTQTDASKALLDHTHKAAQLNQAAAHHAQDQAAQQQQESQVAKQPQPVGA